MTKKKSAPWQITTIAAQMGGLGLTGAFVYVGASQIVYTLKDPQMEKGLVEIDHDKGTVKIEVGLTFTVNLGDEPAKWKMIVAVDTNDTYTVILWKPLLTAGKVGEIVKVVEDVYCDVLQETVERVYDEAVKEYQNGFIYI